MMPQEQQLLRQLIERFNRLERRVTLLDAQEGGGAVDSVNGNTGVVVLDSDDIAEGVTNLYLTQERVEDYVAAQFTGNTGLIDATYNDTTGAITLTLDVSAADKMLYSTAADTWAETTLTSFMRTVLDDTSAALARGTLGLAIGVDVQGYDAELAALAGLTSAADRLPYFSGSGTAALATFTSAARNLLDDANVAAMRTTLGLGSIATEAETAYALLAGRSGGQTLKGGTGSGDDLMLSSTNHATKGTIGLGSSSGYDEVNDRLGIGRANPDEAIEAYRAAASVRIQAYRADSGVKCQLIAGASFGVFGTGSAHDLAFFTNGADVGRFFSGGGLVVGLTSMGASVLGVKAGTSSNDAAVGGVLYVTTTQTGNVGTGEDDLASYSVPANTLAVNGQSLWFEAWGTFAANANNKTVRVRFGTSGTNLVFDSGAIGAGGFAWHIRGRIWRTGAATQKGIGSGTIGTPAGATGLNQTLSGAVTLKVTGEATSNNDIVIEGFIVGWDDNNS